MATETQLKLQTKPDNWDYLTKKGKFEIRILPESWSKDSQYFVLVDEINRGKVSKIFGELLFAMSVGDDDNYVEIRTQYSKTPLLLLSNLHIIATMNTSDKSIDSLDQALKRRFEFRELMPLRSEDLGTNESWRIAIADFEKASKINLSSLLDWVNDSILAHRIDYDRQIGHSYMFKAIDLLKKAKRGGSKIDDSDLSLRALFKVYFADIFPILQEFFLDSRDALVEYVPKEFLAKDSLALNSAVRRLVASDSIEKFNDIDWTKIQEKFRSFATECEAKAKAA